MYKKKCPSCGKLKERYGWKYVKREKGVKHREECKECADQAMIGGHLVVG